MSSQYALIAGQWPELHEEALKVEQFALSDPRTACFYARRTIELLVEWVYENESQLERPCAAQTLADLMYARVFCDLAGEEMRRFRLLKDLGNKAVHRSDPIRPGDAVLAARELFQVLRWFALTYGRDQQRVRGCSFNADLLPSRDTATAQQTQSREHLEALAEQLEERDTQLRDQRLAVVASQEELDRLRQEITALRRANETAAQPDTTLLEIDTRGYIDYYLEEAGWVHGHSCTHQHEVQGMPNATGTGYVDDVLWGDDGKPLALVEAKRTSRDPMEGQRQAELYANGLEQRYGQRPLIFLSNGYRHRLWDDLRYPPREVQGFYKKDELETLIRRREIRQSLAQVTLSNSIAGRYYQQRAIRAICESLEKGRLKALLVQATGTGKTRTAISLTELLTRCNWVKRVLFLADRTSLVLQAERAFRRFLPDCSPVNLVTNKGGEGLVFLSTYPSMMNLIDAENANGVKRFGVGHFDLVIIDEAIAVCTRSTLRSSPTSIRCLPASPPRRGRRSTATPTNSLIGRSACPPMSTASIRLLPTASLCPFGPSPCRCVSRARVSATPTSATTKKPSGTCSTGTKTCRTPVGSIPVRSTPGCSPSPPPPPKPSAPACSAAAWR